MDSFIKRALYLSGLALMLHCAPLKHTSDLMILMWNKSYEAKLIQENRENFRREAETIAETEVVQTTVPETQPAPTVVATEVTKSEVQTEETTAAPVAPEIPRYSVNGHVLPVEIQVYLYNALAVRGIGWFYPYAMLIAYQESNFNIYAENPNGLDKGLFQYRIIYVPWMDWTNPYAQIEYFSDQMANRANMGCTVSDMISRHNMSDYGPYNQDYVNHVMSWEPGLIKIN